MTSAESTLLGIIIGAALAWLGNVFSSRAQWRREEMRHLRDRRAELYIDTLTRLDRLERTQFRSHPEGRPGGQPIGILDEQGLEDFSPWEARIMIYASADVKDLFSNWGRAKDAPAALVARTSMVQKMRAEVVSL